MSSISTALRQTVTSAEQSLLTLSDSEAAIRPAPNKWSPKEIIGHLIDSAANNHGRFIRAQLSDNLVFDGYDQEAWVRLQDYQQAEWKDLISLWSAYNLHLTRVIERIPDEVANRKVRRHNLHQIAWKTVPEDESTTLSYFIQDYINHMKHHLFQIPVAWKEQ